MSTPASITDYEFVLRVVDIETTGMEPMRVKAKEQVEKTLAQISDQADAFTDDFRGGAAGGLSGGEAKREVAS